MVDLTTEPIQKNTLERSSFYKTGTKIIRRTGLVDQKGKEVSTKTGEINVILKPDQTKNTLKLIKQTVGTSAVALNLPEDIYSVSIYHQTDGTLVHFGSSVVDTTYPTLAANDVLELEGDDDLNLFVLSDTASTPMFIQYMELV